MKPILIFSPVLGNALINTYNLPTSSSLVCNSQEIHLSLALPIATKSLDITNCHHRHQHNTIPCTLPFRISILHISPSECKFTPDPAHCITNTCGSAVSQARRHFHLVVICLENIKHNSSVTPTTG